MRHLVLHQYLCYILLTMMLEVILSALEINVDFHQDMLILAQKVATAIAI